MTLKKIIHHQLKRSFLAIEVVPPIPPGYHGSPSRRERDLREKSHPQGQCEESLEVERSHGLASHDPDCGRKSRDGAEICG